MGTLPIPIDPETDARILRAETEFVEVTVGRVVIRNAAEVGTHARSRVLIAPHGCKIHEPDRDDAHVTDPKEGRDGLVWIGLAGIFWRCAGGRGRLRQSRGW